MRPQICKQCHENVDGDREEHYFRVHGTELPQSWKVADYYDYPHETKPRVRTPRVRLLSEPRIKCSYNSEKCVCASCLLPYCQHHNPCLDCEEGKVVWTYCQDREDGMPIYSSVSEE
jgi:hypothetical protein